MVPTGMGGQEKRGFFHILSCIHYCIENFQELNLGKFCFYCNLQRYTVLPMWRALWRGNWKYTCKSRFFRFISNRWKLSLVQQLFFVYVSIHTIYLCTYRTCAIISRMLYFFTAFFTLAYISEQLIIQSKVIWIVSR